MCGKSPIYLKYSDLFVAFCESKLTFLWASEKKIPFLTFLKESCTDPGDRSLGGPGSQQLVSGSSPDPRTDGLKERPEEGREGHRIRPPFPHRGTLSSTQFSADDAPTFAFRNCLQDTASL